LSKAVAKGEKQGTRAANVVYLPGALQDLPLRVQHILGVQFIS
jgi:hypothetical protein